MTFDVSKDRVIEFLHQLADDEFQRRVWLASSGPEVSSFAEAVSGLFDDTGLGDALENEQHFSVFTPQIDDNLRQLGHLVIKVAQPFRSMAPAALIEDARMREIRSIASRVLARMEQEGIL
jgi:hypothetical protein